MRAGRKTAGMDEGRLAVGAKLKAAGNGCVKP
jgi:hypothetical protein